MHGVYRHSQIGYVMRAIMLVAAAGCLASTALPDAPWPLLLVIASVLVGAGWIFSALTIEVTPTELTWFFGPGVWRQRVARTDIASAATTQNKWWYGFGVHQTPRGWLYNVAGLEAVEVTLRDGTTFRLGTDEAEALERALNAPRARN